MPEAYLPQVPPDLSKSEWDNNRAIADKQELDIKRRTLSEWMVSDAFIKLPPEQQQLLRKQSEAMLVLSNILGERIAAFVPPVQ